ncbi:MAG: hypothetical protein ACTSU2_16640 [Promethearchaeota archaeon]
MGKKKVTAPALNITQKLKNIKILYSTNRIKEAIAYLFVLYSELSRAKFGTARKFSQTLRDYAIICVKEHGQNPQNVYPFIQVVEKAIYGGIPITGEYFQDTLQKFSVLFRELTGSELPHF